MKALKTFAFLSLAISVLLGTTMRWIISGDLILNIVFNNFRHAHAHLGYYGLLFPLAWAAWYRAGANLPNRLTLGFYIFFNILAFVGFITQGYAGPAIAGSTGIALIWIITSAPLLKRTFNLFDPLAMVFWGVLLSLACIPPIAINLRSNPALSSQFIATFLSALLFLVIVPSTLASRPAIKLPWPALLLTGSCACLSLGILDSITTRIGTILYAILITFGAFYPTPSSIATDNPERNDNCADNDAAPSLTSPEKPKSFLLPLDLRIVWLAVAAGICAVAIGLIPNQRQVVIGAIHFLVLGPVLGTLVYGLTPRDTQQLGRTRIVWWIGHACWGGMSTALVAQAFGAGFATWRIAAAFGTLSALWWLTFVVRWTMFAIRQKSNKNN